MHTINGRMIHSGGGKYSSGADGGRIILRRRRCENTVRDNGDGNTTNRW
jgi:hypothetical protein